MAPIWLVMIPGIPFDATVIRPRPPRLRALPDFLPGVGAHRRGVGFAYAPSFATYPSSRGGAPGDGRMAREILRPRCASSGATRPMRSAPRSTARTIPLSARLRCRAVQRAWSPRAPSDLTLTPWVHAQDLAKQGMAIICSAERRRRPDECSELVRSWGFEGAEEVKSTVATSLLGFRGPDYQFPVFFVPPHSDAPAVRNTSLRASFPWRWHGRRCRRRGPAGCRFPRPRGPARR